MLFDEALDLQHVIFVFPLDASECNHRRLIVRCLEDTAEQAVDVVHGRACALAHAFQAVMREIGRSDWRSRK